MKIAEKELTCWIVTEGMAGTENQCLGIAQALGAEPEVKRIGLRFPWTVLSPFLGFEHACTFIPALTPPWPDVLIASGRKSIAASRYIKRQSGGRTYTVQVQDPRIDPGQFDLVALPRHDPTRGDNVILTTGNPNRLTQDKLEDARKSFASQFEPLKTPRVAVLIGGNSKAYTMTAAIMRQLCADLKALDAGLMITASRRTGAENLKILQEEMAGHPDCMIWDGSGENPYFGFLAWADYILVTADSTSMLSDAATTGKPVYIVDMEGGSERMRRFHQNLLDCGAARFFYKKLENWTYPPLNDAQLVADRIRADLTKKLSETENR